jgi:thiamine-phosphate pyrophosphorylase
LAVYSQKMLLCAITSRLLLPGNEQQRRSGLIKLARSWALGGVDYIQVREKDLPSADLLALTTEIVAAVKHEGARTRVLLNGPAEIALAAGADGIHLPGNSPPAAAHAARELYRRSGLDAIVSYACHSVADIQAARVASLILFAPVFEKVDPGASTPHQTSTPDQAPSPSAALPGRGLPALVAACRAAHPVPVLALGGVTRENAAACIAAGAAGIAAIRLFLGDDWRELR